MVSISRPLTFVVAACALAVASCAGAVIGPSLVPAAPASEAIVVLPGFGYNGRGEDVFRALAPMAVREGFDLFVPTYLSRSGLVASRANLQTFIRERRLDRYRRLHVFAFIAGAWTLNPIVETDGLPNLATVIYDRSPLQERAPRIALEDLRFFTWLRYGSPVFDVARTPYTPLTSRNVKIGLLVETVPTNFIRDHEKAARSRGAFSFECDALLQRHDDCAYLAMSHDELYLGFADVWPDVLTFIRTGRFSSSATRTPPVGDPFSANPRR